jgi:hypothetical protein
MPPSKARDRWQAAFSALLLVLCAALASPTSTVAQGSAPSAGREPGLSDRGRILLSGMVGGSWSRDHDSRIGTLDSWRLNGTPSVTYFLRDHIGAGLHLGAGVSRSAGGNTRRPILLRNVSHLQVGVHGLFEIVLRRRLSLLLWPALAYVHEWIHPSLVSDGTFGFGSNPPAVGATFQQQAALSAPFRRNEIGYVRCALSVPLLVRLSPSVGIGFGPDLWFDFIVRRDPNYGRAFQQMPAYFPDDGEADLAQRYPEPARRRFQVGLSTVLVVAL